MTSRQRFLDAISGVELDRPPVWLMRQAGRYLPEYREVRGGTPFMEFCRDVDRAVEVSLQPWRRFGTDAVIFFSDILVPLEAMGLHVSIGDGGPSIGNPVRTGADVARLHGFDPERETGFVPEILRRLCREVDGKAALLGFAGAPWTTASYAIEGASGRSFQVAKTLALREPALVHDLLARIADATALYLRAQIDAGVDAVQLFDTWAGELSPSDYAAFAAPYQARVFSQLPAAIPRILFVNGAAPHLEAMAASGAGVLSLDWRVDLAEARRRVPGMVLQGNVDPCTLLGPLPAITGAVARCLAATGGVRHIVNLGHGVLKETPPDAVAAFVAAAKGGAA
jgi:uroporphyrinogen decarboxylase